MVSQRLIQHVQRQRRFVSAVLARQPLLRRTATGGRMARGLDALPDRPAWRFEETGLPVAEAPEQAPAPASEAPSAVWQDAGTPPSESSAEVQPAALAAALEPQRPITRLPAEARQPDAARPATHASTAGQPVARANTPTVARAAALPLRAVPPHAPPVDTSVAEPRPPEHAAQLLPEDRANTALTQQALPPEADEQAVAPAAAPVAAQRVARGTHIEELPPAQPGTAPQRATPDQPPAARELLQAIAPAADAPARCEQAPAPADLRGVAAVQQVRRDEQPSESNAAPLLELPVAEHSSQPALVAAATVRAADVAVPPAFTAPATAEPAATPVSPPSATDATSQPSAPPTDEQQAAFPARDAPRSARFTEGIAPTRPMPAAPSNQRAPEPQLDPVQNATEIFTSELPERTPQEWATLLFEATQSATRPQRAPTPNKAALPASERHPAAGAAIDQPAAAPAAQARASAPRRAPLPRIGTPTPVSEPARRFLHPLVGVDPASAQVYRGAAAAQIAASQAADGVTVGDDILLAADHDDSPESLGLLAHELTHVARRREPRFVPPVARAAHRPSDDEETLARTVEARAIAAARAQQFQPASSSSAAPMRAPHAAATPDVPQPPDDHAPDAASEAAAADEWGGLPAPWEPLPEWAAASWAAPPAPSTNVPAAGPSVSTPPASTGGQGSAAPASVSAAPVQLAARDRSVDMPAPDAAASAPPTSSGAAPAPDLDALAQQVYAVLKQRLATERRRFG